MPVPTLVTLTGRFTNPNGTPALPGGRITFQLVPSNIPDDSVPETVVPGPVTAPIVAGSFTVNLRATDDPELEANVDGPLIYRVTRTGMAGTVNISLPAPGPWDWTDLEPLPGDSGAVVVPGGGGTGLTVDTGEAYRIIMFSNGDVRAIPVDAVAPNLPTSFARLVRVNSVLLSWVAAVGAATYAIWRDDVEIGTTSSLTYRDGNVVVGSTYSYTVQSVSADGLRSAETSPLSAFIDPTLNVAPTVEIRAWPATVAGGNRQVIRVNGYDVDGQVLATILNVDLGSLIATPDPTVWHLEVG